MFKQDPEIEGNVEQIFDIKVYFDDIGKNFFKKGWQSLDSMIYLLLKDIMGEHKIEIDEKEALEEAAEYFGEFD